MRISHIVAVALVISPLLACVSRPVLASSPASTPGLRAFPGAEGFGASTPGGRGGKVLHVTNLKASGPGSLSAACQTPGPRFVVFDVSGVIIGDVVITEPYLTIAGQTAPGGGITLNGRLLTAYRPENPVHDVVVRFLRLRIPPGLGNQGDCVQFSIVRRAILDHLSMAWAEDETVDLFTDAHEVTVQWCTFEDPSKTEQSGGGHHYGLIAGGGSDHLSIHHNLFSHVARRIPSVGSGPVDFRNNVAYDFRDGLSHEGNYTGTPGFNVVGNYYKPGPSDRREIFPFCFEGKVPYYLRGNYIVGLGVIKDPWAEAGKLHGLQYYADEGVKQERETPAPPVRTTSATAAYDSVLRSAGCFPRDAITSRTIAETRTGTGSWGKREPPDLLAGLKPGKALRDTDRDGMPDAWEKSHRLNPKADDSAKVMKSGYTAIEEYVNGLAEKLIGR